MTSCRTLNYMNNIKYLIFILGLSCTSVFIQDEKINAIWVGKHHSEIVEVLGSYNRSIDVEKGNGRQILIWEASKDATLLPIEKLGIRFDKKETSISSFHVFIDKDGYIIDIKKSVW